LNLNGYIQNGASPRATIALTLGRSAMAFLSGRHFVIRRTVKSLHLTCFATGLGYVRGGGGKYLSENVVEKFLDAFAGALMMRDTANSKQGIMSSMRQLEIRTRRMVNDSLGRCISFGIQRPAEWTR